MLFYPLVHPFLHFSFIRSSLRLFFFVHSLVSSLVRSSVHCSLIPLVSFFFNYLLRLFHLQHQVPTNFIFFTHPRSQSASQIFKGIFFRSHRGNCRTNLNLFFRQFLILLIFISTSGIQLTFSCFHFVKAHFSIGFVFLLSFV